MIWSCPFRPVTGGRQFSSKRALPLHFEKRLTFKPKCLSRSAKADSCPTTDETLLVGHGVGESSHARRAATSTAAQQTNAKQISACAEFLSLRNQNQGREPDGRGDEAKPQNGFCCSLTTGRARRALVDPSCFLVAFFGSSATLGFAIAGAGSAVARIGTASDGSGGTHGESADRTTVLGGCR